MDNEYNQAYLSAIIIWEHFYWLFHTESKHVICLFRRAIFPVSCFTIVSYLGGSTRALLALYMLYTYLKRNYLNEVK